MPELPWIIESGAAAGAPAGPTGPAESGDAAGARLARAQVTALQTPNAASTAT